MKKIFLVLGLLVGLWVADAEGQTANLGLKTFKFSLLSTRSGEDANYNFTILDTKFGSCFTDTYIPKWGSGSNLGCSGIRDTGTIIALDRPLEACAGAACLFAMDTSRFSGTLKTWGYRVNQADTYVGEATAQTLTNKTIDCAVNTCTNFPGSSGATVTVRAYAAGSLTVTNEGEVPMAFESERWDTNNLHSTVSNVSRITLDAARSCVVTAGARWSPHPTGVRSLYFVVNGNTRIAEQTQVASTTDNTPTQVTLTTVWTFAAGDYIEAYTYQNSGQDLVIQAFAPMSPDMGMQCF